MNQFALGVVVVAFLGCAGEAKPQRTETRADSLGASLFPKTPAGTGIIDVWDIRDYKNDYDRQHTARALQGVVNANGAILYLIVEDADDAWITSLSLGRPVAAQPFPTGLVSLYSTYSSYVSGFALYGGMEDPGADWSYALALSAAAQTHFLPVTESVHDELDPLGTKPVEDFRTLVTSSTYPTLAERRIAAFQSSRATAIRNSALSNARFLLPGTRGEEVDDYVVSTQSFVTTLDWNDTQQFATTGAVTQRSLFQNDMWTGQAYPLMGYSFQTAPPDPPNPYDTIATAAAAVGAYGMPSSFLPNASFWSSFPRYLPPLVSQFGQAQQPGHAVKANSNTVYYSLVASDGDNLSYNAKYLGKWLGADAKKLNIGISLNPGLIDIASPLLQAAYQNIGPSQELMGAPNGLGYTDPIQANFQSQALTYDSWLTDNAAYMGSAGLTSAQVWAPREPLDGFSAAVHKYLQKVPVTGVFTPAGTNPLVIGSQVVGPLVATGASNAPTVLPQELATVVNSVSANANLPVFAATQLNQIENPHDFLCAVLPDPTCAVQAPLNTTRIWLTPRDWFETIRLSHVTKETARLQAVPSQVGVKSANALVVASFSTVTPQEEAFLVGTGRGAIDGDHRYADLDWSWTYRFSISPSTRKLSAKLWMSGKFVISASTDNVTFTTLAASNTITSKHLRTVELSGLLPTMTGQIFLKFQNFDPSTGNGPSLWSATLETPTDVLISDNATTSLSSPILFAHASAGVDSGHLFADGTAFMTFRAPTSGGAGRNLTAEIKLAGEYAIDASTDGTNFTRLATGNLAPGPQEQVLVLNLDPVCRGLNPSFVFLKFTDPTPQNGRGPSVWNIKVVANDLLPNSDIGTVGFSAGDVAMLAPAVMGCNSGSAIDPNGPSLMIPGALLNTTDVLVPPGAHRFADASAVFTYQLVFPRWAVSGEVTLDLAGEFKIEASSTPDCGTMITPVTASTGNSGRHVRTIDVTPQLSGGNRVVYLRFADSDLNTGFGPSVWSILTRAR